MNLMMGVMREELFTRSIKSGANSTQVVQPQQKSIHTTEPTMPKKIKKY